MEASFTLTALIALRSGSPLGTLYASEAAPLLFGPLAEFALPELRIIPLGRFRLQPVHVKEATWSLFPTYVMLVAFTPSPSRKSSTADTALVVLLTVSWALSVIPENTRAQVNARLCNLIE